MGIGSFLLIKCHWNFCTVEIYTFPPDILLFFLPVHFFSASLWMYFHILYVFCSSLSKNYIGSLFFMPICCSILWGSFYLIENVSKCQKILDEWMLWWAFMLKKSSYSLGVLKPDKMFVMWYIVSYIYQAVKIFLSTLAVNLHAQKKTPPTLQLLFYL